MRLGAGRAGGVDALLRPEDVSVELDPSAKDFVTHRSFLGATTRLIVQVGEIPVRVDVRSDFAADLSSAPGSARRHRARRLGCASRLHVPGERPDSMTAGTPRLVVVGGGVIGTMHAVEGVRRGYEVVQLERDVTPRGASCAISASSG